MKTITFKELIELIEQGKAPKEIRVSSIGYYYKKGNYYNIKGSELIQIPSEPLLTDEEKAYLKAVIEPFKDKVEYIIKRVEGVWVATENYESVSLNLRDLPYKFENMELYKQYFNLKDLDLE